MISADYVVQQLCRMMGNEKGMYGIEWSLDRENGYRTIVNGVGLYLCECEGLNAGGPKVYLFLFKDGSTTRIVEPSMLLAEAPIGKFLQSVTSFFGMDPWPKLPETPEEEANERLRIALNKLHSRACEQDDFRVADDVPSSEGLRAAIAKGMFRKDFFTIPECDEGARQELFRELLRLKPRTA